MRGGLGYKKRFAGVGTTLEELDAMSKPHSAAVAFMNDFGRTMRDCTQSAQLTTGEDAGAFSGVECIVVHTLPVWVYG